MLLGIDEIKVSDRIRKDFSTIERAIKYEFLNQCVVCGNPFTDRHHLVPKEMFGLDTEKNIVYLCATHHRVIHFLLDMDRMEEKTDLNKERQNKYLSLFCYVLVYEKEAYEFFKEYMTPAIFQRFREIHQSIIGGESLVD